MPKSSKYDISIKCPWRGRDIGRLLFWTYDKDTAIAWSKMPGVTIIYNQFRITLYDLITKRQQNGTDIQ